MKFWELEECGKSVLQHFKENTIRDKNGRFVVTIPLKDSLQKLGDSRQQAEKRFIGLERKLSRNAEFKREYDKFINEYEQLGHMKRVSDFDSNDICYYMPHHGVWREDSTTNPSPCSI